MAIRDDKAAIVAGLRFGDGGRYEIRERIGRGGMADVYKAVDTQLNNRLYAVKIFSSGGGSNAETLRTLFIDEAQALSRIRDNNVVAVITNGRLADDTPYMVMEYLDGQDLSSLLKKEKRLDIDRSVDIILSVCAGINACHLANVIHRDLKPANIFLDRTLKGEEPKVLDFSVAKVPISRDQTNTGFVVGTASYMAPEQANGKPADERSDQFSIGALLYTCLTGQSPRGFLARPRDVRPEIPEDLERVVLQAMDPAPERRFGTVHEFGRSLLAFASQIARARWTHYYTSPPLAIRAAFTSPLRASAPPTAIGESVTRPDQYDFRAHDRTTRLAKESALPMTFGTTIPDAALPDLSTVEASTSKPGTGASTASTEASGFDPSQNLSRGRELSPSIPRRLLVPSAVALFLLVVATLLWGLRRTGHESDVAPPSAPAWTRSIHIAQPVAPTAIPPNATEKTGSGQLPDQVPANPTAPVSTSNPEPNRSSAPEEPSTVHPAVNVAPAQKRHRRISRPAVPYTSEGIPIMR